MLEFTNTEELFSHMNKTSYSQEDFDNLSINLIDNFSIIKNERDSFGSRKVCFKIVELEIYWYNKENNDWQTYNRDCVAGQWFFHRSGVDIAFQTQRNGTELEQFGGILIRGLERIVNGQIEGYIGGPQRCLNELFNCLDGQLEICHSDIIKGVEIFRNKRVRIDSEKKLRYYRQLTQSDWELKRDIIYTKKKGDEYFVIKDKKTETYADAPYHSVDDILVFSNK